MTFNRSGVLTLFKKELNRIKAVWKQTVFGPVLTNLLFLVIFGVVIAGRSAGIEGIPYLTVLVPGLVAMAIMMNAFQNPMSSLMVAKYTNNIGDLLMLPLHGIEIALAYIAGGIVRGLMVGGATLLVGMAFTPIPFTYWWLIIIYSLLLGGIFASFGVMIGIISDDFDKAAIVPTFLLTPLIYLGGVFYSIDTLPPLFAKLSLINPIFYLVDGFRFSFLGVGSVAWWISLSVTVGVFLIMGGIASWMFHTGYKLKQ